jgi:hypothetical protein
VSDVLLGMEIQPFNPDDPAAGPHRAIIDIYEQLNDGSSRIARYTIVGEYQGYPDERTVEHVMAATRHVAADDDEQRALAEQLTALDIAAAEKIRPIVQELLVEQTRVLHGDATADWLAGESEGGDRG